MKKILTFILIIILHVINAQAQVAINKIFPHTNSGMQPNTTLEYLQYKINSLTKVQKTGGLNIIWQYDSCELVSSNNYTFNVSDTTAKLNSNKVAGRANVALNEYGIAGYGFYDLNNKFSIAAEATQIFGNNIFVVYNNNIELGAFPMNYGTTNNAIDTANEWIISGTNKLKRFNNTSLSYDGYGSLKFNNTIIDSVSRIKIVQNNNDSLTFPTNGFLKKIVSKRIIYYYMRKKDYPIAIWSYDSIVGTTSLGGSIPAEQYNFLIDKSYQVINSNKDLETSNVLMLYPNPTNDKIFIKTSYLSFNYTIYNTLGKKVVVGVLKNNEYINIRDIDNGIYNIVLYNEKININKKIIKE